MTSAAQFTRGRGPPSRLEQIMGMFQFERARLATCYVSTLFRNLSVRSHAVLAQAGS